MTIYLQSYKSDHVRLIAAMERIDTDDFDDLIDAIKEIEGIVPDTAKETIEALNWLAKTNLHIAISNQELALYIRWGAELEAGAPLTPPPVLHPIAAPN